VRAALAEAGRIGGVDLAPLGRQNGMFATLPLDKAQIEALRLEHGIYMAGSGRINLAGLTTDNTAKFIAALAEVAAAPADAA
jgi:aromatic-amino-acid transaminase